MSEENVEVARRVSHEFTKTQQFSDLVSPDLVWHVGTWSDWTGEPEFHGQAGFLDFSPEWTDAYEDWSQEVEDITEAGDSPCELAATPGSRCGWGSSTRSRTES
jgi:hypothetical protein